MTVMSNDKQQVIALAGLVQALNIVHEVATQGQFDSYRAQPLLRSLVTYNPDETLTAFGGHLGSLQSGMQQLRRLLSDELDRDIAQYLLAVISIELKLVNNVSMRQLLQQELQTIGNELTKVACLDEHGDTDDNYSRNNDDWDDGLDGNLSPQAAAQLVGNDYISRFANLYKQTASQTEPRIMIKGNHQFLQDEISANWIRALLLAALRAAAFFRHYGGKRMNLMMKRGEYLGIIEQMS